MLTKEQILSASDLKRETVPVPEWGGEVIVSEMTAESQDAFELGLFEGEGESRKIRQANMRARMLSFCLIDDDGELLFTDAEIKALGKKSGKALARLFDVAQRLNKRDEEAVEAAKKPSAETHGDA